MRAEMLLALAAVAVACDAGPEGPASAPPQAPTPAQPATDRHGLTRAQAAQVVVKVGDSVISLGELATLMGPAPLRRHQPPEAERRRAFVDRLVRTELLYGEARRRGLDHSPMLQRTRRQAMVDRMLEDVLQAAHAREGDITEAELGAYYEANLERLTTPEMVHAAHILVDSAARAARVLRELQRADDPASAFSALARTYGRDAKTAERGGDLGWFAREGPDPDSASTSDTPDAVSVASLLPPPVPAAVREHAFTQREVGALSVVHSELGHHVVRYLGRRPAQVPQLAQIARTLRQQMADERRHAALDALDARLLREHPVERHEELLPQVRW